MKTKQQLQNEAYESLQVVDQALASVPAVPYEECSPDGRAAWNKLAVALLQHRTAVALWKAVDDGNKPDGDSGFTPY